MNEKIKDCLIETFPKKIIKDINKLGIGSFKEWDSLAHLNILLLVEKKFKVKFTIEQMYEIKKIADLKKVLKSKKK